MDRRVKFTYDDEATFEECNGETRPLTREEYSGNEYMKDGDPIPYEEYLRYYGNPDRHVYLGCITQEQCGSCVEWKTIESLWGIDFMDDSPEYLAITLSKWYTEDEAKALPGFPY